MLRSRIIPCLLISNKGLVKTIQFKSPKYVGDPINAVKIFNEKEVDELIVLDIDATVKNHGPDYKLIKDLAVQSRMPLCYGGGIKTVKQAVKIISLGVEKIALSSSAIEKPLLVKEISEAVGCQSIVIVLDVKKDSLLKKYSTFINNGTKDINKNPVVLAKEFELHGAGEIVINSIDNDGLMQGYDDVITKKIRDVIDIPLTVLGGAGGLDDFQHLIDKFGTIGLGAGSYFVFKGPYRAVLISYNKPKELIF